MLDKHYRQLIESGTSQTTEVTKPTLQRSGEYTHILNYTRIQLL